MLEGISQDDSTLQAFILLKQNDDIWRCPTLKLHEAAYDPNNAQ